MKKQTGDAAKRMLLELEGLPLSMARKLDPCELYEFLFWKCYVNLEEKPDGTQDRQERMRKSIRFDLLKTQN